MPYLLHDCGNSTVWSPQVHIAPRSVTTTDLFGTIADIKPNVASDRLAQLAGTSDPLEVLRQTSLAQLQQVVTEKQAVRVLSAVEMGRRMFVGSQPIPKTINSPKEAFDALSYDLSFQSKERFAVLSLNVLNKLLCIEILSIGTATETLASPREIFGAVLKAGGTRCIIAHNHPSGGIEPSYSDLELTRKLLATAQVMEVPILDHLILGQGRFSSLRETTTLWSDFPQD